MGRIFAALAAVLVFAAAPSAGSAGTATRQGGLAAALVARINDFRAAHGLVRLRVSPALTRAATGHSAEMARLGFFSHSSADGTAFATRIGQAYSRRGFRSWSVGENLAWGAPGLSAAEAFKLWLASPPHRTNLLTRRWREIGVGAIHSKNARGIYRRPVTIVTADFGERSR